MNKHAVAFVAGLAALTLWAKPAPAQTTNFGGAGFVWHSGVTGAPANQISVTGDYWEEAFAGPNPLGGFMLNLAFDSNSLADPLHLDVLLNTVSVGGLDVSPLDAVLTQLFDLGGAPATGGSYTVRLQASNTPSSGGLVLNTSGRSSVSVSEPTSLALLGGGILMLWTLRRRVF